MTAPRCREASAQVDEPTLGTAPVEPTALIVEQPGPWGRDAVAENRMEPVPADAVRALAGTPDVRVLLARRGAGFTEPDARHCWLLERHGGRVITHQALLPVSAVPRPAEVRDSGEVVSQPLLFVCTNGRRDRCCAEFGRKLVAALTPDARIWEVSHLGGHRFAPTALRLPDGLVLGRLTADAALAALDPSLPVPTERVRGRIGSSPAEQVAEWAVASATGIPPDRLGTTPNEGFVTVADETRRWRVDLRQRHTAPRPSSCGATPGPAPAWTVTAISKLAR